MKLLLSALIAFLSAAVLFGQTEIISEDFESYSSGSKIAQTSEEDYWTTWSGVVGGADDPEVTGFQSHKGDKSLNILAGDDPVLLFNDKTSGRYQVEFYILINSGAVGYFNLLHDFAGANSSWGLQVFFLEDGTCSIDANGPQVAQFPFFYNQWIHINAIVDLDDDFGTLYVDGREAVSWVWSKGAFGEDSLKKLDAMNFFGWTTETTGIGSNFFIDDIKFSEAPVPEAPSDLQLSMNEDDFSLSWTAPSTAPDSYLILKNNYVLESGITETNYEDLRLYPGTYRYSVKAHYDGLGYSHSTNEMEATLEGGVDRNVVLYEINTGTWCGYCPGAAMGADELVEHDCDVAVIEYHNDDDYANQDCAIRENYYQVEAFPTATVDGAITLQGGSATESLFPSYFLSYKERNPVPSVFNLDVDISGVGGGDYRARVTVEQTYPYYESGLVLRTALTESHIQHTWQGLYELNFVCRKMFPDAHGTPLNFSSSQQMVEVFEFSLNGYEKDNCEFVAFIQHDPTKEVVQTTKVDFETVPVEENNSNKDFSVYPNPTAGILMVESNGSGKIEIYDAIGNKLKANNIENTVETFNLSDLNSGVYFIRYYGDNGALSKKIVVQK